MPIHYPPIIDSSPICLHSNSSIYNHSHRLQSRLTMQSDHCYSTQQSKALAQVLISLQTYTILLIVPQACIMFLGLPGQQHGPRCDVQYLFVFHRQQKRKRQQNSFSWCSALRVPRPKGVFSPGGIPARTPQRDPEETMAGPRHLPCVLG